MASPCGLDKAVVAWSLPAAGALFAHDEIHAERRQRTGLGRVPDAEGAGALKGMN